MVARHGRPTPNTVSQHDWLQDDPAIVYDTISPAETSETSLGSLTTGGILVICSVCRPCG
jgi:hypothetical protein